MDAIGVLNRFTGGPEINNQVYAIQLAGEKWQAASMKLISDAQSFSGQLSEADSKRASGIIAGPIATDFVTLYNAIKNKKSIFVQVGAEENVYAGLAGIGDELQRLANALVPLLLEQDLPPIQVAANQIYAAALDTLNAYS